MTLKELAVLTHVSVPTVSKAFHDAEDISEETKAHIFAVAKEYGCFGKYYKGKFHKKVIAIICPELKSNHYAGYVDTLRLLIEEENCIPVVAESQFAPSKEAELIEYFASYLNVDGVIVLERISDLKKGYDTPIVSVLSGGATDSPNVDLRNAMQEAVKTLKDFGHEKIAFLGEMLTKGKRELFQETMGNFDLEDHRIFESKFRFEEAGMDGIRTLRQIYPELTAVICAYDNIAFGAVKQLKQDGVRVPEDISIVGMDNISFGEYTGIPLTTIDTNPKEVCVVAWDLLQKKMKSPYYVSKQNITIYANLVVRESVGQVGTGERR